MITHANSIGTRIVLLTLIPLILVMALMAFETHYRARQVAEDLFDDTLLAIATTISENVVASGGDLLDDNLVDMLEAITRDRVYYRVSGPGGAFVAGHATRPGLPEAFRAPQRPLFTDAVFRGEPVRVVALSFDVVDTGASGNVIVHVWQTVNERRSLLREFLHAGSVRSAILIALAGAILWWGVWRGLRPLQDIGMAVERRGVADLRPIEREVPREIAALVGSMNRLFARLNASVRAMEGLISNASHQIRTPLAAIRTRVELARQANSAGEVRGHLDRLAETTERTSRLAEQLLNLARVESAKDQGETFDAAEVAREATAVSVKSAIARGIDLGFDGPEVPVPVRGDALFLREALHNVIGNALEYCPAGAVVTVSARIEGAMALVDVVDDGPGVPAEHRHLLGERFFRVPGTETVGCGLGLAIAKEAATRLLGSAEFGEGPNGTGFAVRFRMPVRSGEPGGTGGAAR